MTLLKNVKIVLKKNTKTSQSEKEKRINMLKWENGTDVSKNINVLL